jgi:hypothetical protein
MQIQNEFDKLHINNPHPPGSEFDVGKEGKNLKTMSTNLDKARRFCRK